LKFCYNIKNTQPKEKPRQGQASLGVGKTRTCYDQQFIAPQMGQAQAKAIRHAVYQPASGRDELFDVRGKAILNAVYEVYQPFFDNSASLRSGQICFECK
jgi:hypothetical protein